MLSEIHSAPVIYSYRTLHCLILGDLTTVQIINKNNLLFSPLSSVMETFQTELLLAICYCHLSLSVPKMMHLSLNPHLPKPWRELNWHSSANSPATDHRTISVTMIPRPDSFQSFGNNRWVVKLKSLNKEDNINTIRNWSFLQATPSLLPFLATYHITN